MGTQNKANEMIYGSFLLGRSEFAINARELQEVVNLPDDLERVPLAPDFFMGVFSLREAIVPVINMRELLRQPPMESDDDTRRDCIAIIRVGKNRMGLLFDRTSEVLRIGRDQIQHFTYPEESSLPRGPVQGVISLDQGHRLVQVIDSIALLSLPDIPLSNEGQCGDTDLQRPVQARRRCITFGAGGNRYGFRIDAVNEIIPMEPLGSTGLISETCIGRLELRGTVLPVLDFTRLLNGAAVASSSDQHRIIITRIHGQPIGFRVDFVEGIIEYRGDELQPLPHFGADAKVLLAGCIVEESGADICLIDHEKLYSMPEITVPAETSHFAAETEQVEAKVSKTSTCLLVNLGFDFVLPVADISEIIDCPGRVSRISGTPDYIEGVFNLRKKVVTVVDMRLLYGIREQGAELEPKLLIAEHGDSLVGLRVDGVKDIVKIQLDKIHATPAALLAGWSQACQEDIENVLMSEACVLPLLPLLSALERVSPSELSAASIAA